jgi:hypothetical protein
MGTTYTRQESGNITDGSVIEASHLNNEFNQLESAFASSTGHSHDGTAGEGAYVPLIADSDANNKILVDTSSNRFGVFVEVSSNPVEQFRFQDGAIVPVTTNDIDLGTAALQFKDAYFDGTVTTDGLALPTTTITDILDEDNMSSDSATALATQQSIKAYVDSQVTAQDLDFQADSGGALSIDLDSESLTFTGGTGIDTSGSGNAVTFAIDSTVATLTGTQTLTNKTLTTPTIASIVNTGTLTLPTSTDTLVGRATTDTLTNKTLTSAVLNGTISGTSIKDEDDMSSDSASHLATQQSIKAYVDAQLTAQDLDFQGDSGGALSIDLDSETLDIAGGTGIDTSGSGNTLTVAIDSTVATLTGTQTLTNKTLTTPTISSITNTGTLTLPTSTDTLVGRATTDTLTNKTLTSAVLNGTISGTSIKDEDDMTSDSASHLATQQSIKAYVDSQVATANELSELTDVTITSVADNEVLAYDSTSSKFINQTAAEAGLVTLTGTETLTNKTLTSPTIDLSSVTSSGDLAVADGGTGGSTASAARTNLGLVIGTDVQAYDAELAAIAGLTSAADKGIQFTGSGTAATYDLTTAGKALLDDADASAQRTTLGLGTSATLDVGTSANNVVQLDGSARLPAVDGSQLTGLSTGATQGFAIAMAVAL